MYAIDIELRGHPVYKSISLICNNIYLNSVGGKQIMFLYGVDFSQLTSSEIAVLMFGPEWVEVHYGDSVNTMTIKMVDTHSKHIKLER